MVSGKQAKQRREEIARNHTLTKKKKALSTGWIISIIAVLFFGGVIGFVAWDSVQDAQQKAAVATDQTPANTVNDGWTVTADGITTAPAYSADRPYEATSEQDNGSNVTMYVDYDCPSCGDFDRANGEQLKDWLADGTLDSLSIHPLAFVSPYSDQAFNAMACVADRNPDALLDTHLALMANQPGGTEMPADQFTKLLADAGNPVGDGEFDACVEAEVFTPFITAATRRAMEGPLPGVNAEDEKVTGTPTIFINGERYSGDPAPEVFAQAVKGSGSTIGFPPATTEPAEQ